MFVDLKRFLGEVKLANHVNCLQVMGLLRLNSDARLMRLEFRATQTELFAFPALQMLQLVISLFDMFWAQLGDFFAGVIQLGDPRHISPATVFTRVET